VPASKRGVHCFVLGAPLSGTAVTVTFQVPDQTSPIYDPPDERIGTAILR